MRSAGILCHISSLPNHYGIGTLGYEAYEFIDFLYDSGQRYWQILPINPTSYGDSPYQPTSSFAFNPYFIDFDLLKQEGLIEFEEYSFLSNFNYEAIDYAHLFENKLSILKCTYKNSYKIKKEFFTFKNCNKEWLDDYALFMSLKEFHNNVSWNYFDCDYNSKNSKAISNFKKIKKIEIDTHKWMQFLFYRQWMNMLEYAHSKGILIIGDMPIYVAYDSSDVWCCKKNYLLDEKNNPVVVAGCPPDDFTADGQLWGNPIYNYSYMKKSNYKWWVNRIKHQMNLFDAIRIDHFRGFAGFYQIDYPAENAKMGKWVTGPGIELFEIIKKEVPNANIIAEDLGLITKDVKKLLHDCGYPGMNIMMFDIYKPYHKCTFAKRYKKNRLIYTGTHDNSTLKEWIDENKDKEEILNFLEVKDDHNKYYHLIEKTLEKECYLAIVPIQDYLCLGSKYRMNIPGASSGNWQFRCLSHWFSYELRCKILNLIKKTKRFNDV